MVINKATIKREERKDSLILHVNNKKFEIVLTEDNPNNVKTTFNGLLKELEKGLFNFNLEDSSEDLYHSICEEYLKQLNVELKTVFDELVEYKLIEE